MPILYLHQYFKTPKEPGGTRSYWFAKELIKKGFDVTMLTSRNKQTKLIEKEEFDGINVIYIRNPYDNNMHIYQRLISFMKFMVVSTYIALRQKNIQLVFATSTPLTIGFPALILKWFKGKNFIFEVRDLWPEFPIQIGALQNKLLQKLAICFEKIIYNNSEHVIALSPGMKEGVAKYIPEQKVSEIPNMAKIDFFFPRKINEKIAKQFDINIQKFNVIHFGAMGVANGLEYIIETAKICEEKQISDVEFLFLGEGMTEKKLKQLVHSFGLSNVKFLGAQPMSITSEIVNIADCSIVSFLNLPVLETNSPNKLFDSLSAGKPIIVNSAGWTKQMVEANNCGMFTDPESPLELWEKISFLKKNPSICKEMSHNARKLAETTYDKSILSKKFAKLIKEYV